MDGWFARGATAFHAGLDASRRHHTPLTAALLFTTSDLRTCEHSYVQALRKSACTGRCETSAIQRPWFSLHAPSSIAQGSSVGHPLQAISPCPPIVPHATPCFLGRPQASRRRKPTIARDLFAMMGFLFSDVVQSSRLAFSDDAVLNKSSPMHPGLQGRPSHAIPSVPVLVCMRSAPPLHRLAESEEHKQEEDGAWLQRPCTPDNPCRPTATGSLSVACWDSVWAVLQTAGECRESPFPPVL